MILLSNSIYFGAVLTLIVYAASVAINKKWNVALTNPLLISSAAIIGFLYLFGIPYPVYAASAKYLEWFLTPAVVCFAVPMYKQLKLIREYKVAVLLSILFGCAVSVASVIGLAYLFGVDELAKSLVTISTTTAIGVNIVSELGGIVGLTIFATILTGILGNIIGCRICGLLCLSSPAARGLAIGNSSHAAGTAKALEIGQVEGAFASLSVGISGVLTAILAPLFVWLFS